MRTNHFAKTLAGVILGLTTLGSALLYMADVILQLQESQRSRPPAVQ